MARAVARWIEELLIQPPDHEKEETELMVRLVNRRMDLGRGRCCSSMMNLFQGLVSISQQRSVESSWKLTFGC